MSIERPVTSRARGVCRYYSTSRGCFAGSNCKFLHGEDEKLTPYDKNKTCRYYAAGYCKRGAKCWFQHVQPTSVADNTSTSITPLAIPADTSPNEGDDDDDLICSICYEVPVTFGLLDGCSHVFCIDCIKGWRDPKDKGTDLALSGNTKRCPACRTPSKFVTPSSTFYASDHPGRARITEQYKASMARVPCRYFVRSSPRNRFCPFGKDCFYQHLNEDGTKHEFQHGVEYCMRQRAGYNERQRMNALFFEQNGPLLEQMHATIDSIRASLEGDIAGHEEEDDDDDDSQYGDGQSVPASFLQRLTDLVWMFRRS